MRFLFLLLAAGLMTHHALSQELFRGVVSHVSDGDTLWVEVTAWKALGEGAAESLRQGSKVIVTGELRQRNWLDKEGNKRVTIGLDATDVGVSVRASKSAPVQSEDAPW